MSDTLVMPTLLSQGYGQIAKMVTVDERMTCEAKCIYALLAKFYAFWLTIPVADRPAMMTIYRSTSVNDVTGETTQTFQFQFKVTNTGTEVADES